MQIAELLLENLMTLYLEFFYMVEFAKTTLKFKQLNKQSAQGSLTQAIFGANFAAMTTVVFATQLQFQRDLDAISLEFL